MTLHLAVFDLDDTLIAGDSMARWHHHLVASGLAEREQFLQRDAAFTRDYIDGTLNLDDYLAFSLSPVGHMSAADIDAKAEAFVREQVLQHLFPEAKARIAALLDEGVTIAIISASLAFLVHPVAKALGAHVSMGMDLKRQHGMYLPIPEGVPSFQEGKVHRLANWMETHTEQFEHISFYTDSINDLPMCLFADDVFVVNPCPKLFRKASEYQWPVLRWGKTTIG